MQQSAAVAVNRPRTIKQLCDEANVSRSTVNRAIISGKIRVVRFGRTVRIPAEEAVKVISRGW